MVAVVCHRMPAGRRSYGSTVVQTLLNVCVQPTEKKPGVQEPENLAQASSYLECSAGDPAGGLIKEYHPKWNSCILLGASNAGGWCCQRDYWYGWCDGD